MLWILGFSNALVLTVMTVLASVYAFLAKLRSSASHLATGSLSVSAAVPVGCGACYVDIPGPLTCFTLTHEPVCKCPAGFG